MRGQKLVLDPDEFALYEVWKANRLTNSTDLSVHAYNLEQEALALAWEAGAKVAFSAAQSRGMSIEEVLSSNPNRAKGMKGERHAPAISTRTEQPERTE